MLSAETKNTIFTYKKQIDKQKNKQVKAGIEPISSGVVESVVLVTKQGGEFCNNIETVKFPGPKEPSPILGSGRFGG